MEKFKNIPPSSLRLAIGFAIAICLALSYPYLSKFIQKDICLDKGGSLNDLSELCEMY